LAPNLEIQRPPNVQIELRFLIPILLRGRKEVINLFLKMVKDLRAGWQRKGRRALGVQHDGPTFLTFITIRVLAALGDLIFVAPPQNRDAEAGVCSQEHAYH
jgi:hypothetical protein